MDSKITDWEGKACQQGIERQDDGVRKHLPEFVGVEEPGKVLQSHKGALQVSQVRLVVFERDDQSVQRRIVENEQIEHGRSKQEIELPVLFQTDPQFPF